MAASSIGLKNGPIVDRKSMIIALSFRPILTDRKYTYLQHFTCIDGPGIFDGGDQQGAAGAFGFSNIAGFTPEHDMGRDGDGFSRMVAECRPYGTTRVGQAPASYGDGVVSYQGPSSIAGRVSAVVMVQGMAIVIFASMAAFPRQVECVDRILECVVIWIS